MLHTTSTMVLLTLTYTRPIRRFYTLLMFKMHGPATNRTQYISTGYLSKSNGITQASENHSCPVVFWILSTTKQL